MGSGTTRTRGGGAARLLAVAAAAALIVGGLVVRGAIDDDDEGAGVDPPATTDTPPPAASTDVVCVTELEAVCTALQGVDVTIEPAGDTLDALAGLEDPAAAPLWITIEPFPAMVDAIREADGLAPVEYTSTSVAATELGVVMTPDRWDFLAGSDECGSARAWRCLGDWAGGDWSDVGGEAGWRTVRPAVGDAGTSAFGLAAFANAVAGYVGDGSVDSALFTDVAFITWFDGLTGTVTGDDLDGTTPLADLITRSRLDVAAAATAEFQALPGARTDELVIQYPEPSMWATAVLASPASTSAPDSLADDLAAALTDAAWDDPGTVGTPLPDAPTMLALRLLWRES